MTDTGVIWAMHRNAIKNLRDSGVLKLSATGSSLACEVQERIVTLEGDRKDSWATCTRLLWFNDAFPVNKFDQIQTLFKVEEEM